MYKCYACGKEIERPGELCPFCRFPVISTLHGDPAEEEEIRQFAEEYKKTNPQFFPKVQPQSAVPVHDERPVDPVRNDHSVVSVRDEQPASPVRNDQPAASVQNDQPAATEIIDEAQEWKRKYEELLKKEKEWEALGRQEEERKRQEDERRRKEEALKQQEIERKRREEENKRWVAEKKRQESVRHQAEARAQQVVEEKTKKKKKKTVGWVIFLLILTVAAIVVIENKDIIFGNKTAGVSSNSSTKPAVSILPSDVKVGDYVTLGKYEQDNYLANGKEAIEWLVLAKEDDQVLLISRYGLDCLPFNTSKAYVSWEDCTLRTWLNQDFLTTAFNDAEQAAIPKATITMDRSTANSINKSTEDRVFLLSSTEAKTYFSSGAGRQCEPTAYAISQGCYVNEFGFGYWWLRSRGNKDNYAARVVGDGSVNQLGSVVNADELMVRPAIWVYVR